jgi:hypothetical protein
MKRAIVSHRGVLARGANVAFICSALALLGTAGCAGKGTAGSCGDIASCGGNPVGKWTATGVCQFAVPQQPLLMAPAPPANTTPQSPNLAAPPPTPTTAGDWCSGLVYLSPQVVAAQQDAGTSTGPVQQINFWSAPLNFQQATVAFNDDKSYSLTITVSSPETTHFAPACLRAYGANPTCDELTAGLLTAPNPNYGDLTCSTASDGGCDCSYVLEGTQGNTGTWSIVDNIMYAYNPLSQDPPQAMNFCVSGAPGLETMTLSGHNGAHLPGAVGVRSMALQQVADADAGP